MNTALEFDSSSIDALQTMASLRLSQNRKSEACEIIEAVYMREKALRDQIKSRTVLQDLTEVSEERVDEEFTGQCMILFS